MEKSAKLYKQQGEASPGELRREVNGRAGVRAKGVSECVLQIKRTGAKKKRCTHTRKLVGLLFHGPVGNKSSHFALPGLALHASFARSAL